MSIRRRDRLLRGGLRRGVRHFFHICLVCVWSNVLCFFLSFFGCSVAGVSYALLATLPISIPSIPLFSHLYLPSTRTTLPSNSTKTSFSRANACTEQAAESLKSTVGMSSSEARGKVSETTGATQGKASEMAGEAKGKAQEMAGEAKGKAQEVKGEVKSRM